MPGLPKTIYRDAGKLHAVPVTNGCASRGAAIQGDVAAAASPTPITHGGHVPENMNAAYRRLVLDARSLLPHCEMPVARMLFAEWLADL